MSKIDDLTFLISQDVLKELKESKKDNFSVFKRRVRLHLVRKIKHKSYLVEDPRFFWKNGLYAMGLLEVVKAYNDEKIIQELTDFYKFILPRAKRAGGIFVIPDHFIHAEVLLEMPESKMFSEYIELALNKLVEQTKYNDEGIFRYRGDSDFYLDGIGFIIGFLVKYYEKYRDESVMNIVENHISFVLEKCIDETNGMPFHAYNLKEKRANGTSTWGRGMGWFLLGLSNALIYIKRDDFLLKYKETVDYMYSSMKNGYIMEDMLSDHIDTSPTVMLAYCVWMGICNNWLDESYEHKLQLNIQALIRSTDNDGKVNDCSGECKGAGSYSREYGNFYSQGFFLKLLSQIKINKKEYLVEK